MVVLAPPGVPGDPVEDAVRVMLKVQVPVPAPGGPVYPEQFLGPAVLARDGVLDRLDVFWPGQQVVADLIDERWRAGAAGGVHRRHVVEAEAGPEPDPPVDLADGLRRDAPSIEALVDDHAR